MGDTYSWAWYTDDATLRVERERIFRLAWHYVGHDGRLAEPSTYFASDTGGIPAVIVRDAEGGARAFLNVCRHRGAEIVSGEGRRETLQCPYHAWTSRRRRSGRLRAGGRRPVLEPAGQGQGGGRPLRVPPQLARVEAQRLSGAAQPVDRPDLARRAGADGRVSRLLLRLGPR
jgi:nitrite reductase/ring-hydroxylating ferredoxin subunit